MTAFDLLRDAGIDIVVGEYHAGTRPGAPNARQSQLAVHWLCDPPRTPPFSAAGRGQAGAFLRLVQAGKIGSIPVQNIKQLHADDAPGIKELKFQDKEAHKNWRIIFVVFKGTLYVLDIIDKQSEATMSVDRRRMIARYRAAKAMAAT